MQENEIHIQSKLPNIGTTIFSIMSKMASDCGAINLSQGFPDFSSDPELIRLVNRYMKAGKNQYAPMQGIPELREAITRKIEALYSMPLDPESEINICSGGTEAIYSAITAMIHDGDEVIVIEPAYDCYVPSIRLNGGIPIFVELETPALTVNWEAVKNRISQRTRMIIINTPNNPGGSVFSAFDLLQLEKITTGTDIIIVSDEVYEHIIFDGLEHQSILRFPNLFKRSFVIFSFGKTYHNTGWKLGYCLAPDTLMKEFRRVHQFIVFSSMTPVQYALADYMNKNNSYLELSEFYQKKRDFFLDALSGSKFKFRPSLGTYFQLLDYSEISDLPDMEMAEKLTRENGIASIPVSAFYNAKTDNKVLRFCFAKSEKTLKKAADILNKIG